MVGVQGCGKSATANSMLGLLKHFRAAAGTVRYTQECDKVKIQRNDGRIITIVDTPAIMENIDIANIQQYLLRENITEANFIFVVKAGRYDRHEIQLLKTAFYRLLGKKRHVLILTNSAEIDPNSDVDINILLEMYINQSRSLQPFAELFDKLVFGIDNLTWSNDKIQREVTKIIHVIEEMPDLNRLQIRFRRWMPECIQICLRRCGQFLNRRMLLQ